MSFAVATLFFSLRFEETVIKACCTTFTSFWWKHWNCLACRTVISSSYVATAFSCSYMALLFMHLSIVPLILATGHYIPESNCDYILRDTGEMSYNSGFIMIFNYSSISVAPSCVGSRYMISRTLVKHSLTANYIRSRSLSAGRTLQIPGYSLRDCITTGRSY